MTTFCFEVYVVVPQQFSWNCLRIFFFQCSTKTKLSLATWHTFENILKNQLCLHFCLKMAKLICSILHKCHCKFFIKQRTNANVCKVKFILLSVQILCNKITFCSSVNSRASIPAVGSDNTRNGSRMERTAGSRCRCYRTRVPGPRPPCPRRCRRVRSTS